MLSFCDNKDFPSSLQDDDLGYLSMDLKSFYVQPTQGEVASVEGEAQLQTYMQVSISKSFPTWPE